jgi:putative flippase GtrA
VLPYADKLLVHCESGISRSAGITAAISKYYFGNDNWVFNKKIPNMHCYMQVLEKFYQKEFTGDKND